MTPNAMGELVEDEAAPSALLQLPHVGSSQFDNRGMQQFHNTTIENSVWPNKFFRVTMIKPITNQPSPQQWNMKMHYIFMLYLIVLGCSSGDLKERKNQTANSKEVVQNLNSWQTDTTRPILTPEYRWIQVRQSFSHSNKNIDRPVHSHAYRALPKQLLSLWLTESGYVEYKPCNGINQSIEVKADTLILNWALESMGYQIKHIYAQGADFLIQCGSESGGKLDFRLEALRVPESSYLLSWQDEYLLHQWLVIPVEHRYSFDFITNPCPDEMLPEKTFKEIDFTTLEKK